MENRLLQDVGEVLNNMAGRLREVVVKELVEVRSEARAVKDALRDEAAGSDVLQLIDSGHYGDVELPGRLRRGNRAVRLGTDRIVGIGRVEPTAVLVELADGTQETLIVSGVIDVRLAIEVKGRTNALGGVAQLRGLGGRARGYCIMGDELWLLTYDRARVRHLLVAPPGRELSAARTEAASLRGSGFDVGVIEIPRQLDDDIIDLARGYLEAAAGTGR